MTPAGPSLGPALSGARPHGPPGMDHGHPVHQDPHPSVPPNSEADSAKGHVDSRSSPYRHSIRRYLTFFVARVSSLPPERKANALIFLSALLVLGRGAGELAFLRSQDRVKSANSRTRSASSVPDLMLSSHWLVQFDLQRRKKVGRALLISAHGLSSIRMALVLAEWIEHAYHAVKHKPQEHKKQEAGPEAEEDEGICSRFGEALGWGAEALEMGAFVGSALALVVRYHHSSRTGRRWHHVLDHWAEQAERGSIWYVYIKPYGLYHLLVARNTLHIFRNIFRIFQDQLSDD